MGNVLADLFGDIAQAIRDQNGSEEKMSPASFPEKIRAIEGSPAEGVDPYYLGLSMALVKRDASYLGDPLVLDVGTIVDETGSRLGSASRYAYAGYEEIVGIKLRGALYAAGYEFVGCTKLKYIDVTVDEGWPAVMFTGKDDTYDPTTGELQEEGYGGAFRDCPALEAIIVRPNSQNKLSAATVWKRTEINENAFVYVPAEHYEAVKTIYDNNTRLCISSDRIRKLEDYPAVDKWNEKFTVEFYDGDTLIGTQTVRYGGTASMSYSKEGYNFLGWNPTPENVTEDMKVYADLQETFAAASWETIAANASNASKYYPVGSEKTVTLTYADGTTEDVVFVVAGFGVCTGDKMTIVAKHALKTLRPLDTNSYTAYGGSDIDVWLNGTFFNALPADLQGLIVAHDIDGYGFSSSKKKVWLPNLKELGLTSSNITDRVGKAFPLFNSNARRIRTQGASGSAVTYYTRSSYTTRTGQYYYGYVATTGALAGEQISTQSWGVVPGFCI